jgi:autotransporter translocation and assembly factor TamB
LSFSKVALRKIFPRVDSLDLDGRVNGELNILQKDNIYFPNSNLDIADFEINQTVLGNLDLDLLGNGDLTDFIINAKLLRDKEEKLRLLGNVFKSDSSDYQTKLLASFNAFPLDPFSPLGKGVIGDIRGGLWGNAEITGPLINPDFTGTLTLNKAGISVPYLGVNYDFSPNAKIGLYHQVFDFKDITLIDKEHNTQANLSGTIDHRSFRRIF